MSVIYLPTNPPRAKWVTFHLADTASDPSSSHLSFGQDIASKEILQKGIRVTLSPTPNETAQAGCLPESLNVRLFERDPAQNDGTHDKDAISVQFDINACVASSECEAACERIWIALFFYFQYSNGGGPHKSIIQRGRPVPSKAVKLLSESDGASISSDVLVSLERLGLIDIEIDVTNQTMYLVYASTFWQLSPELFLRRFNPHRYLYAKPLRYVISEGTVRHPKRPLPPPQKWPFYTRHCITNKINSIFRLRPVDMSDLENLHKWMNNPRVSEFWGEQGPIERQKKFLETCLQSTHSFTAIGQWNDLDERGRPTHWRDACFFDFYWVKEDRLSRYANNIGDWDRGVHLLIGEEWARGRSSAWLSSILHCMYSFHLYSQMIVDRHSYFVS
jgi:RimJ/RimL family protein N-acetyltransferase